LIRLCDAGCVGALNVNSDCRPIFSYFTFSSQSIELDGELLFDRAIEGRFPEVKEIKQMIRDKIDPKKDLGHSDIQEVLDGEEAAEQRRFFGVD
jgi:hypothetical protein